jgi:hypothetical protein
VRFQSKTGQQDRTGQVKSVKSSRVEVRPGQIRSSEVIERGREREHEWLKILVVLVLGAVAGGGGSGSGSSSGGGGE